MKLPRFRLRTLLVLVLLAGLAAWGLARWLPRYRECRHWADYHASMEAIQRQGATNLRGILPRVQAQVAELKQTCEKVAASGSAHDLAAWESLAASVRDQESELLASIAKCDKNAEWHRARSDELRRVAVFPWLAEPPFQIDPD